MTDIRHTEVFVYESKDEDTLTTEESLSPSQFISKGEQEGFIDTGHLSVDVSMTRFSGTQFDARKKDFSDSLANRKQRQKYEVVLKSNRVEPDRDEFDETPMQRYERLRAEVSQLLSDIEAVKAMKKDTAEEEEIDYVELTRGVQNLQLQLSSSQKDVSELLGLGSSAAPVLQPHLQSDLTQRLLARLDAVTKAKPDTSQAGEVTYELYYTPDTKEASIASRIADFDKRLSALENVLSGNNMALIENSNGLAGVTTMLKEKIDSISEDKIEALSERIKSLTEQYERLKQSAAEAVGFTPEQEKKVDDLYQLVSKIETVAVELPLVVDRLVQLRALHEECVAINSQWKTLDAELGEVSSLLTINREQLEKLEKSMAANAEIMQKNLQTLQSRFDSISAALQKQGM